MGCPEKMLSFPDSLLIWIEAPRADDIRPYIRSSGVARNPKPFDSI
jgi:hypothetical protein